VGRSETAAGLVRRYTARRRRQIGYLLLAAAGTLALAWVCAVAGVTDTAWDDLPRALVRLAAGESLTTSQTVLLHLRLPRVVLAVLAGVGLSVSGAAMQGVTRNPLVSPFTLGISNAAAFGASLAIVFGVGVLPHTEVGTVLTAFGLALLCTAGVYLAALRAGMSAESIVLTGIAVNYLFSAATSLIQYFADEHRLAAAVAWAFGSFNGARWDQVGVVAVLVTVCFGVLQWLAPSLDLLAAGDDEVARSLGVHPGRVRVTAGIFAVLATAAVISFTGVIGFVGLAGPHMARLCVGGRHRLLLPFSAVTGAALLLAADTLGRLLLAPVLLPVGIVVSFLGVPLFINLILTRRKGYFG
jgi:iron complex transport system permease protein